MQSDSKHFRRVILRKLYSYLQQNYPGTFTETIRIEGFHRLDSLLAFKSDSYLEQLRAALSRLDEGTFGVCLNCKKEIDAESMDADPTCRMCKRCERAYSPRLVKYQTASLPV